MENNNIYYKKYLKYKIKYINLLNNYQSNKNINEQISGKGKGEGEKPVNGEKQVNTNASTKIKDNKNKIHTREKKPTSTHTPTLTSTSTLDSNTSKLDSNSSNNDKRKKKRTRRVKKKNPANTALNDNQFLYYFKRLLYNFETYINTSDKFKNYVTTNITDMLLNEKLNKMKTIICEVENSINKSK